MHRSISLIVVLLTATVAQAQWASLEGKFIYGDKLTEPPAASAIQPTKDVEVCGKNALFDERLIVNKKNRGLANVVIWAHKPKKIHAETAKKVNAERVTVANANCRFEPHVLTATTEQLVEITNPDTVGHNAQIMFLRNTPVNPLIPPQGKVELKLTKSEFIPVTIRCSIHPWMEGRLLVQDHPYMAVTDADGKFKLANLPAGNLTLKVWHEKIGYIQSVDLDGEKTAWKKGKYQLELKPGASEKHTYQVDPNLFAKK